MSPKKILFLVPYPLRKAPSQRFRVELFLPLLQEQQLEYRIEPFLDEQTWKVLYTKNHFLQKLGGVVRGFIKRLMTVLFIAPRYDYIFIHREAAPLGPPIFEFYLSRILRKKVIYDFDDAIWIPDSSSKLLNVFKAYYKIGLICRWAHTVVGGNDFLCNYARKYNSHVVHLPTCVDVENHHSRLALQMDKPVIGWTGSHSTLKYLDPIVSLLASISERYGAEVLIICNKPPAFSFPGLVYIPWSEKTEVADLRKIHIGLMPLVPDAWSEGKCGFKLIQYLSLGIPAVASPVGINRKIIDQGLNGFLCTMETEWEEALQTLLQDSALRQKFGQAGREKIIREFSIQANAPVFLGLFD